MADDKLRSGALRPWVRSNAISLGVLGLAELALGFFLNQRYTPTLEAAHRSLTELREGPLANAHYWASAWLILHGFAFLFALILSGEYRKAPKAVWLGTVALVGCSLLMQVTGNLLPMDRHDVQTVAIEGSIASRVPVLGAFASNLLLQGDRFGQATLEGWHRAHLLLVVPFALGAVVTLFGFTKVQKPGRPWWLAPMLAVAALSFAVKAPYGPAANSADFAAFDAAPGWYTWPMHGALNAFESLGAGWGWIGSFLMPGLLSGLLILAPWLGNRWDGMVRGGVLALVLSFLLMGLFFGGRPAPMWGKQDVALGPSAGSSSKTYPPVDEAAASRGLALAKKHCAMCHGKDLTGSAGAPNLTQVHARNPDPEQLESFIRNPKSIRPSSTMPAFEGELTPAQILDLVHWLRSKK